MSIILAVLILAGCILAYPRRSRELIRLGSKLGLRYSAKDVLSLWETYGSCYLMQYGHSPRIVHVLSGRVGHVPMTVFEYHLEAGSGLLRRRENHSVILVNCRERLPLIVIRRKMDFEAVGRFQGFERLKPKGQAGQPLFMYSNNPPQAAALLPKAFLDVLEDWDGAQCEFHDGGILFYSSERLDAGSLERWIHQAKKAAEALNPKGFSGPDEPKPRGFMTAAE